MDAARLVRPERRTDRVRATALSAPAGLRHQLYRRQIAARSCHGRLFARARRSEEHTSELQSLMRTSYAVFCLKKKKSTIQHINQTHQLIIQKPEYTVLTQTINIS